MGLSELPTTVLKSINNDLASDTSLLAWDSQKDRRIASVVIILGAIGGAWHVKGTGAFKTVLMLGAAALAGFVQVDIMIHWYRNFISYPSIQPGQQHK